MTFYDFIFSEKKSVKIKRHLAFWVAYIFIIFNHNLNALPSKDFSELISYPHLKIALVRLLYFLPSGILSVYFFVYFLYQKFLKRKRYTAFILWMMGFLPFIIWMNYYFSIPFIHYVFPDTKVIITREVLTWTINNNTIVILSCAFLAFGFKIIKAWLSQQKENLIIAKERTKTELKLLTSRLHPDFIITSLSDLHVCIEDGAANTPQIILQLSDILSYTLYECSDELVPVEKELSAVKNFISFHQLMDSERPQACFQINGTYEDLYIAPLTLLLLSQDLFSFSIRYKKSGSVFNILIEINNAKLICLLSYAYNDFENTSKTDFENVIIRIKERLNALYRNSYTIHKKDDKNNFTIELELYPKKNIPEENNLLIMPKAITYETV